MHHVGVNNIICHHLEKWMANCSVSEKKTDGLAFQMLQYNSSVENVKIQFLRMLKYNAEIWQCYNRIQKPLRSKRYFNGLSRLFFLFQNNNIFDWCKFEDTSMVYFHSIFNFFTVLVVRFELQNHIRKLKLQEAF